MQNTQLDTQASAAVTYRERLTPSLWIFITAAVVGPMAGIVLVPVGSTVALLAGSAISALVVVLLAVTAPAVRVVDGVLHVGRAHIEAEYLGEPVALSADDARQARGPGLNPRSWHLIRGGIAGLVVVPVEDADDPVPEWVISSRTPDRLAAAIRRAQRVRRRTPGR